MGRLPTADDLGFNHPSAGLAVIKQPESGLAEGLQTLGRTIAAIGLRDRAEQEQLSKYKLKSDLENFQWDQKIAYQQVVDTSAEDGSDIWARREAELQKVKKDWDKRPMSPEERAMVDDVFNGVMGQQRFAAYEDARTKRFAWQEKDVKLGAERTLSQGIPDQKTFGSWWNAQVAKIDATDLPIEMKDKLKSEIATAGALKFGRDNPQAFIGAQRQGQGGTRIPIVTGTQPGRQPLDMSGLKPEVIDRWERVQGAFGRAVPIVSAYRDEARNKAAGGAKGSQHLHGNAIDVNVTGMTRDERVRLIETASAMGFTGIGVYANSLHFDTGNRRAWGPDRHFESVPPWAYTVIAKHVAGKIKQNTYDDAASYAGGSAVVADAGPQERLPAQKPTGGLWDYMPSDVWDGLNKEAARLETQRVKDEEDARKAARQETIKAGYDLVFSGDLSKEWIDDNRDAFTPSEYRTFNSALQKQSKTPEKSDNGTYIRLTKDANEDDNQDAVQDDILQEFSSGNISKGDYQRLMSASRRTAKARVEKPWANELRSTLRSRLAPADREDTAQYSKRLDGLFAFDDWLDRNPKATRDDAKKKADDLYREYSSQTAADLRAGLDMPRYATVGRYAFNGGSIAITAQRLAQAYKEGKITKDDLNREAQLLKRWKSVLDEEQRLGK